MSAKKSTSTSGASRTPTSRGRGPARPPHQTAVWPGTGPASRPGRGCRPPPAVAPGSGSWRPRPPWDPAAPRRTGLRGSAAHRPRPGGLDHSQTGRTVPPARWVMQADGALRPCCPATAPDRGCGRTRRPRGARAAGRSAWPNWYRTSGRVATTTSRSVGV